MEGIFATLQNHEWYNGTNGGYQLGGKDLMIDWLVDWLIDNLASQQLLV